MLMETAFEWFNRPSECKEYHLVDFPIFKGGNQDPIEWLNAFEKACEANQVARN